MNSKQGSRASSCASIRNSRRNTNSLADNKATSVTKARDIEKGQTPPKTIHQSIQISGMTCTSCAKKGMKVLDQIKGVYNPRINFLTSAGDFDVENEPDIDRVIKKFEHDTGFQCTRITRDKQGLDVVMSRQEAQKLKDPLPVGVNSITEINKTSQSITFNPAVISARNLLALVPSQKLAPPRDIGTNAGDKKELRRKVWSTLLAAVFTIPVLVFAWGKTSVSQSARSVASLVFATCVQGIAVPEFYHGALRSLIFSREVEMDMLVVLSITAAYGYSVVAFALEQAGYKLQQEAFFETSTLLITLVLLGRLVSVFAKIRAIGAVSVNSLQARTALLVDGTGEPVTIDTRLLHYDDQIIIPAHAQVVSDGIVVNGASAINESMITGESDPVAKSVGDSVVAGTLNGPSSLTIRLTRLPGKNSITDIANLVENALNAKPRVQDLADKIAGWFIPVVVVISSIVLVVWLIVGLKGRHQSGGSSVGLAITYSIAVLAISCPCALGLAVPMVLIIAGGVAARFGVIIKDASATERAYKTTDVVFDKTGTLTTGLLEVAAEYYGPGVSTTNAKALALAMTMNDSHPVSSAVARLLQDSTTGSAIKKIQSVPGSGLQGEWQGQTVKAGNPFWLDMATHNEVDKLIQTGRTVLCITLGSRLVAAYSLTSTIRPEAKDVIKQLRQRGMECHIASGDNAQAVQAVARLVDIDVKNAMSRQTPSQKQDYINGLMSQGKVVLFCGDGTNDAVAVAQAHTGVQLGFASDVTRATANVVLTSGKLDGILVLLSISRQSFLRICFNFAWAAVYNVFAILLASGAAVKVRIAPQYAGLGEIVSVLPVVLVAVSLVWSRRRA